MTSKHVANGLKYVFFAVCIVIIILAISGVICDARGGELKARIELTSEMIISDSGREIKNFGELKDYYAVPDGYKVAAIGDFKTSVLTIKCSYELLIKDAISTCESKKYHGFGLVDLKRPDIINSCYRSKIIFFVAIQ